MSAERFVDAIAAHTSGSARIAAWSVHSSATVRASLATKDAQTGNAHAPFSATDTESVSYKLVWDDGKVSRGACERAALDGRIPDLLQQARREANDDPDSAYVLGAAAFPEVSLAADDARRIAEGYVEPWTARLARIRAAVRARGFRTWSGSLSATSSRSRVRTSLGVDVSAESTLCSWWASFDGEHGDGWSARALEPDDEFEARLARACEIAALLRVPADGGAAGTRPVLLHPSVVEDLVLETLLHHLGGKTVHKREGWFRKDDFGSGTAALRADITLKLDPLRPLQPGSYRFTQDGLPAGRCEYVREGRLQTPVTTLKYARALALPPTPLPYGLDGLIFEAGTPLPLGDAYRHTAPDGALVLSVLGVHTLDPASGDFSLSAPQVLAIQSNGPVGRFRATISGNLLELLRSASLRAVTFPGERHPGLLVHCRLDPR
jgi:PmbA protein